MKCNFCGTQNDYDSKFCKNCGEKLDDNLYEYNEETKSYEVIGTNRQGKRQDVVICPKCGSSNIHFVTIEEGSDYDVESGCCGYILFGPLGLLCGLATDKRSKTVRKCMSCNHEF